ncbi:MAG: SocA family protein [Hydrococcus sp. SU_1_0]|nr:SocA family protein [Hydrococcus sp. SU_1_0]
MKYLGLLKMLYIADRIALEQLEMPITGDCYFSLKYGPVLSQVYDLIKGKQSGKAARHRDLSQSSDCQGGDNLSIWSEFISPRSGYRDYYVSLRADPGNDELCQEEEEILKKVYALFGHLDPFIVAEWTHGLPEWQQPEPINSAIPIVIEDILHNVGKNDSEIEEIRQLALQEAYLDGVLNG